MIDKANDPRPPGHIQIPREVHDRLLDLQERERKTTGTRTTIRGLVTLLLDREQLYRDRMARLRKLGDNDPEYGLTYDHAADIMAGKEDE